MFFVVVAFLVSAFGGVAFAANITCGTSSDRSADPVICKGTNNSDSILERKGSKHDIIRALEGADTIRATRAGNDTDEIHADGGDDTIKANDGDTRDTIYCGSGTDTAYIDVNGTSSDKAYDCENVFDQNGVVVPAQQNIPAP